MTAKTTTNPTSRERMAPGHLYQPRLGSGIEWLPGAAKLWEKGEVVEVCTHHTASPYEFWRSLAFADCFETVTHWWFRSAWTQRVRLTRPQGTMGEDVIWGYMQFVDAHTPVRMYTIAEGDPPVIAVPFPPNEAQPVNLPLRLALARLAAGVLTGEVVPDEWVVVTSLVQREELEMVFPESYNGIPFRLNGVEAPLRQALCEMMGLGE